MNAPAAPEWPLPFSVPDLRPDEARDRPPKGYRPRTTQGAFTALSGPFYYRRTGEGMVQGVRVAPHHCNRSGVVHGGVLMTLADSVMGRLASEQWREPGLTVQIDVKFVAAAHEGDWLEARAKVRHRTGRLLFCDTELVTGEPDVKKAQKLVFLARGVFSRRPERGIWERATLS